MAVTLRMWLLCLLLLTLTAGGLSAQHNLLSRKITLHIQKMPLQEALERVAQAGGFRLSYDAGILPASPPVTLRATEKPAGKVLGDLLGDEIAARQIGNYVILVPEPKKKTPVKEPPVRFSGTVRDAVTMTPLPMATIYQTTGKKVALTDTAGRYVLTIAAGEASEAITVSRRNYRDTLLYLDLKGGTTRDILLVPLPVAITPVTPVAALVDAGKDDSLGQAIKLITEVEQIALVRWLVPERSRESARNLEIYGTRPFQVSFIPYLGTNWLSAGSVSNAVSFNLLAGYSRETNGFELGGLVNINRHRTRGFQLAGLGNITGSNLVGFQLGGLFNIVLGPVRGFQLAGLVNVLPDTLKGMQLAGLCNITSGRMTGFELAGLCNVSLHHVDGWQVAGLGNYAAADVNQVQIGGLVNYGRDNWGLQLSGLINISKNDNRGAQIAGLVNYTKRLNGFQLGFFNYVNTLESGVPVGFFSFIRNGGDYRMEVSADEVFYANVAFRAGTQRFYNLFKMGTGDGWMMNFTYGMGTMFRMGDRTSIALDLTCGVVTSTTAGIRYHGLLAKFTPTLDITLARRLALFFGPSYNLYWFNTGNSIKPDGIAPYTFYDVTFTTAPHRMQMWVGGTLGLKI